MKKQLSLFALLVISFQLFATVTVTPLWERSRALSNAAANVTVDISTTQKTIAVARDTIFLQDNVDGVIYCYSAFTGDYLTSFPSNTSDMNLTADDAGNLVLFGPEGATNLKAHVREANGTYTEIDLGATKKVFFPTIIGNIQTKAYVWTFPTISGGTEASAYCFEVTNKLVSNVKLINLNILKTLTGRNHFATPISSDSVILNMPNGFTAFIDKNKTYAAIGDMAIFIRNTVPVANDFPTQNGGEYFVYRGRKYFVQGCVNSTGGLKYAGAFKIYDVTNPASVSIFYERTTNLGVEALAPEIMHFQAVVKADGVYIYQYAPLNGMAAYKLADDTPTALTENEVISSCYAENGVVKVVAPLGERVELYNLAGQLITSTTICESVTSFDAEANHFVIVRVAGQTHKVVL
ncbi:MAG TPA: hypothetical protein P5564_04405 [Paludibacteraceae bacterium]|nr:hypothetical protein [Paludibacteraceae bacterium]